MRRILAAALLGAVSIATFAGFSFPDRPAMHVNDYAHVLDASSLRQLEAAFTSFEQKTGHQSAVAIFPTIEDQSVDDVANMVFKKWALGQKGKDDGILLVIAMNEHKLRIEVGYGLEDKLPDALAGRIIRGDLIPYMRQGNPAAAVLMFEQRIDELFIQGKAIHGQQRGIEMNGGFVLLLLLLIALVAVNNWVQYRRTISSGGVYRNGGSSWWWTGGGGGWGGGGWGGGGGFGGGGGWGGGGGGSSGGGGASGGW